MTSSCALGPMPMHKSYILIPHLEVVLPARPSMECFQYHTSHISDRTQKDGVWLLHVEMFSCTLLNTCTPTPSRLTDSSSSMRLPAGVGCIL